AVAGDKAFKWEEQFKEIMANGGFDVVIGNPPYVNNRNLPEKDKLFLEKNFSTAYQQYDLYVLFYELAFRLVKEGGFIGLITPNKFAVTNYGLPLRKFLLEYKILKVVDVSQLGVFGDVSTYPYIVILQKSKENKNNQIRISFPDTTNLTNLPTVKKEQSKLSADEPFLFSQNPLETNLLGKINGECLIEIYRAKPTTKSISNKGEGYVVTNKSIEKYSLNLGTDKIAKKKEWLIDTPAIIMKKICFTPTATLLEDTNCIPVNTVYVVHPKDDKIDITYLLGILNSKLMGYYTRKKYGTTAMRGGFIELRTFEIRKLPIKHVLDSEQKDLSNLIIKILKLKKQFNELKDKQTDQKAQLEKEIQKLDAEIDEEVYKLYGITEEEKKIIEDNLKWHK
ncbi:MAG: TaqI-like C-terminal specificity domain-containing protein, partial [Nanoarchaeota archaeon]